MLAAALRQRLAAGRPTALVEIVSVEGSAPREPGVKMLVDENGIVGTIGGGVLEMKAIEAARKVVLGANQVQELDIPLGPEIGQCCGGRVRLVVRPARSADALGIHAEEIRAASSQPTVLVFGAGHIGGALVRALAPLPLSVAAIDQRAEWLSPLDDIAETIQTPLPEALVDTAPPGAGYVVLTHDHALDFLIVEAALARGDAAYVGMIGSATKRAKLRSQLARNGVSDDALTCPIGAAGKGDKNPDVIALAVAAELAATLL